MKKNFATIILTAIIGLVIAYFIANLLYPSLENFSFKTLDSSPDFSLTEPSNEIFNYRAINPTVEVYVGECTTYNPDGSCADTGVNDTSEAENNANNAANNNTENDATNTDDEDNNTNADTIPEPEDTTPGEE